MNIKEYKATLKEEPGSLAFWRDGLAELWGTFLLVSVQCAIALSWGKDGLGGAVQVGLGMGFIVCCLAWVFGDFGGGHFNPAVTFSMVVSAKITIFRGIVYIIAQSAGGIAGAAFVYGMTPEDQRESLAATRVNAGLESWQGFLIEAWITCILVSTILGSTNVKRKEVLFMPNIPIGFAVALGIMTAFGSTGGSMNPARSLGPAVMMGIWENHWVYWAGPIAGGCVASLVYLVLLDKIGRRSKSHSYEMDQNGNVF